MNKNNISITHKIQKVNYKGLIIVYSFKRLTRNLLARNLKATDKITKNTKKRGTLLA